MTHDSRFGPQSGDDLLRLVEEQPLAWIVSGEGESFRASLMPVRPWKVEDGRIIQFASHFPRHNDQVKMLRENPEAHLLFLGTHGYISASWVRNRTWTPTWNFTSARVRIEVEFIEDDDSLHALLEDLSNAMESGRRKAWRIEEMGERYAQLSKRIIGFIGHVKETGERYKLGQDEEPGNFADILRGLEAGGRHDLVRWMRWFNPGKGS